MEEIDETLYHVIIPPSAACGLCGEVLRGVDDPRCPVGCEGTD